MEPRFSLDLARIIFGEDAQGDRSPDVVRREENLISYFKKWIGKADRELINSRHLHIDSMFIKPMSGPGRLVLARMIEDRCPEVIDKMPVLRVNLEQLQNAHTVAEVLMPSNMAMLIRALQDEGDR